MAAVLDGAAAVRGGPSVAANATTADSIQEIVVTARKRTENLQDVPQSLMRDPSESVVPGNDANQDTLGR